MRDEKVDILRFVGLAMIILAHVDPPSLIFQLRNFDVPLMILVSGISFGISYNGEPYASYVWKRIKRLLFPVWIFLTAYFLFMYTFGYPIQLPDAKIIGTSYLLLSGIGYVWIIRVFLLVAIAAPAIMHFSCKANSHTRYFLVLGVVYIAYELLLLATKPNLGSMAGRTFESTVLYIIPYAIVFAVGLRLPALSRNKVLRLTVGAFIIFTAVGVILYAISGKFISTQKFKYPPSIYYLSYALGVSCVAWLASDAILMKIKKIGFSEPILFVAQNSIWVYLWHIPLIEISLFPFYLKYSLVFMLATVATFFQVKFVKQILLPSVSNASIRKNLNILLTG